MLIKQYVASPAVSNIPLLARALCRTRATAAFASVRFLRSWSRLLFERTRSCRPRWRAGVWGIGTATPGVPCCPGDIESRKMNWNSTPDVWRHASNSLLLKANGWVYWVVHVRIGGNNFAHVKFTKTHICSPRGKLFYTISAQPKITLVLFLWQDFQLQLPNVTQFHHAPTSFGQVGLHGNSGGSGGKMARTNRS